jgi:multimeric flavodoxin WrbA
MNIKGCMACEYCHTKGEGKCIQQDDMTKLMAAMQRVYCIGKPAGRNARIPA